MTLVRAVRCTAPPRFGQPSKAVRVAAMLGRGVAITLVVLMCMSLFVGPRRFGCRFDCSPSHVAEATVQRLAYEEYPSWRQLHLDETCPRTLDVLLERLNLKQNLDPWGSPYEMLCVPDGAIMVMSRGADGRYDTADDITSAWIGR